MQQYVLLTFFTSTLLYSIWYVTIRPLGRGGSSQYKVTIVRLSFLPEMLSLKVFGGILSALSSGSVRYVFMVFVEQDGIVSFTTRSLQA